MNPEVIPVILVLLVLPVICVLTILTDWQRKRNEKKQDEINKSVDELHK